MLAVEARHGQADNLVAGIGYTLHFHASFCTYEQDFRSRTQFLNRVGNGYSRENVSARAATADDNISSAPAVSIAASRESSV